MDIQKEKEAFEAWFKSLNENGRTTYFLGQESKIAWEAWQAAKANAVPEGFVLVPKNLPDDLNDHLWDFMTDNFVVTNNDGDSFMFCDDFDLELLYSEIIKAQEQSHD